MANKINRFGLSRYIPEDIKREIRRACGFGCICCGVGIASYEHIEPLFKDALSHDPNKMAYLCEGCHSKVTRGIWSKQKIWESRQKPWCIEHGNPYDVFDISNKFVNVWLGPNKIINFITIFKVGNEKLLVIEPPEEESSPIRISGKFFDNKGNLLFSIDRNEWIGERSNWDMECCGPRIIVRKSSGKIALKICAMPPYGIAIEQADLAYQKIKLIVNSKEAKLVGPNNACINLQGREVIGMSNSAVLFNVQEDQKLYLGPGAFYIGRPSSLTVLKKSNSRIQS